MKKEDRSILLEFINTIIPKQFYQENAEIILLHAELSGSIEAILNGRIISILPQNLVSIDEERILSIYAKKDIECKKFHVLLNSVVKILKNYID